MSFNREGPAWAASTTEAQALSRAPPQSPGQRAPQAPAGYEQPKGKTRVFCALPTCLRRLWSLGLQQQQDIDQVSRGYRTALRGPPETSEQ